MADAPLATPKDDKPQVKSAVGRFVLTYHTFLSTFVIGAAGLAATSIWQYRQSETARHSAESQEAIAKTNAENQWRIERAEILAKNLQVLASHGGDTADQRYGVLLSLTRGDILDPELAVSYALELGKDNPEYMKSVLDSTQNKDYSQLAHAFLLTCDERFGLHRQVDLCKTDASADRSDAIAHVVSDDAVTWASTVAPAGVPVSAAPLQVLKDEQSVQKDLFRLSWLYTPAVEQLYEHKLWSELRRFEGFSAGAHAIAALIVAEARTGELAGAGEDGSIDRLHAAERTWLSAYVLGKTCDADCRARFADYMLTGFSEAQGDYDELMRAILQAAPVESGPTFERMLTRFSRCQVEPSDATAFRDRVIVPLAALVLAQAKPDPAQVDNMVALLVLAPLPGDAEAQPKKAWDAVLARLQQAFPDKHKKGYVESRAQLDKERAAPPPALRKVSFCMASDQPTEVGTDLFN